MPVYKFKSIEEMNRETWRRPGDPTLYRAMAFVSELGRRTSPRRFEPGVQRYRGIEMMSLAQEEQAKASQAEPR